MIHIISGNDTIIPINDKKEFNIPDLNKWDVCPEDGTHPKYFEVYVRSVCEEAKEKDIWIFTYSPMIVEFFSVLAPYYEVKIEFYLNDKDGCLPCEHDQLWRIYEPLAKPYDKINMYKIKVRRGQTVNTECKCCNGGC